MKPLLFCLLFLLPLFPPPAEKVVSWITETEYDLGDLIHKKPRSIDFQFKNISDQPIVIESVRPQCGCTAPDWDDIPIEPDSIGSLRITYDAHKEGYFRKKVKVFFSGQRKAEKLYIEGYVEQE